MALAAEQMAVLQLLLGQGQSYAGIAGLLGLDEPEVRLRARAALTELGDADPDREAPLTDFLLGQSDPIDRADAIRHLRSSPADREMAARIIDELRAIAPQAELPRLPGEPRSRRLTSPGSLSRPGLSVPSISSQGRTLAAIGAGALVVVIVVLVLTGVFGGGGGAEGESADPQAEGSTTSTTSTPVGDEQAQAIPLQPVGGGDARGVATVGIAGGETPYMDLQIQNLSPPPSGQTYFVWFVQQEGQGYPFVPLEITDSGDGQSFSQRFTIQEEYIPVLTNAAASEEGAIQIWLSPNQELGRNIRSAVDEGGFVEIPGQEVLSGSLAPAGGQVQGQQGAQQP